MTEQDYLVELTADIVAAHVSNNSVSIRDISSLVQQVHQALAALNSPDVEPEPQKKEAAVSVRASLKPDYIVCMECGKKQKTLKRHLQSAHGITPNEYRKDYGLPDTYPMAAPNYAEMRRVMAKAIGLGSRGRAARSTASTNSKRKATSNRRPYKATPAS